MASEQSIAQAIEIIKISYPATNVFKSMSDTKPFETVGVWGEMFKEYDDKVLLTALKLAIKQNKYPPSIPQIIEQIETLSFKPTPNESYAVMEKALYKCKNLKEQFSYTYTQKNGKTQGENARNDCYNIWKGLPESIKTYIGSFQMFLNMADYSTDDLKFERDKFIKAIHDIEVKTKTRTLAISENILPKIERE